MPDPLAPDVIVSQLDALLEAVQEHPPGAVTATVSVPPDAVNERDVVSIVTTHGVPS